MKIKIYTGSYTKPNHVTIRYNKRAWVDTYENGRMFDLCFEYSTRDELEKLGKKLRPLLQMDITAKYFMQGVVEVYLPCSWRVVFGG